MSLSIDRRQAIQGATAATIGVSALPLAANAKIRNDFRAPLVEIFDARGCDVKKQQYIVRSLYCARGSLLTYVSRFPQARVFALVALISCLCLNDTLCSSIQSSSIHITSRSMHSMGAQEVRQVQLLTN